MQSPSVLQDNQTTTAARLIVSSLAGYGIDRVFCVAGESFLTLLDELYDAEIDVVNCRHEEAAAFMAVGDAKLTGKAGICMVNRGPGATNACIALHAAKQDATPFLLIVGDVKTTDMGRLAFQEMDYAKSFSDLAKGVWVLRDPRRAAEMVARAIHVAESGTPGATVLVLPEDLLEAPLPASAAPVKRWKESPTTLSAAEITQVEQLLNKAERPLLIAGARIASPEARRLLREVSERHHIPVAASNKRQDVFDNTHPNYAGHLNISTQEHQRQLLAQADLILAVGTRLDYVTTQRYTLPHAPLPGPELIHVYPDAFQLGYIYQPGLGLVSEPGSFLEVLRDLTTSTHTEQRAAWIEQLHACEIEQATWQNQTAPDGIVFGSVIAALNDLLPGDAILAVDAGNFTSWFHRYFRFRHAGNLLGISSSAMGFGVPGGLSAALRHPDRKVVTLVGDGGFLMTGNELATAMQYGAELLILIANNNSYGTIRQHQERAFPGRVIATRLHNPDFARLAESYGALGLTISDEEQIVPVLRQAIAHHGPAVVEIKTSLAWISAYSYIADLV